MIKITNLRLVGKGSVVASFTIVIPKWGNFTINDCTLFDTNGNQWFSFPSRQFEKDGKKCYARYCHFNDPDMEKQFRESVLPEVQKMLKEQQVKEAPKPNSFFDDEPPF